MKISLKKIRYYVLTYKNETRKQHVLERLKDYDVSCIESVDDIHRDKSGALGHSKLLDTAIQHMTPNRFEPFVILEDDIERNGEFPNELEIPDDTDILYIGISLCGMNDKSYCLQVYYSAINQDLVRVYNMLSSHGYIICSIRGLLRIQKCLFEGYYEDKQWDISMAYMQPYYNAYALRRPLVFQKKEMGGYENLTKIEFKDKKEYETLPIRWKIHENVSIRSNCGE